MSEVLPILASVLTTLGVIVSGYFVSRRLSKFGLTTEQLQVSSSLRQLADVEKQKRQLLETDHAALAAKLRETQGALDNCARQLDAAYAELRIRKRDDMVDETRGNERNARRVDTDK